MVNSVPLGPSSSTSADGLSNTADGLSNTDGQVPTPTTKQLRNRKAPSDANAQFLRKQNENVNVNKQMMSQMRPISSHADVPGYLARAEAELIAANSAMQPNESGNYADSSVRQFSKALENYNTQASNYVSQAIKNGRENVNPSVKSSSVNILSNIVSNLAFSLPAAASTATKLGLEASGMHKDNAEITSDFVFAVSTGLMAGSTNIASSWTRHKLGGTNASIQMNLGDHARTGPDQSRIGELADLLGGTVVYAVSRAAFVALNGSPTATSPSEIMGEAIKSFAIAAGSAAVTGLVKEIGYSALAHNTVKRSGVESAAQLPLLTHNRQAARGVRLNHVKNPYNNLEGAVTNTKAIGHTINIASCAIGAIPLLVVNFMLRGSGRSFAEEVGKVIAAFFAFFITSSIVRILADHCINHPTQNAAEFSKTSAQVLEKELRASSMTEFQDALNSLAIDLEAPSQAGTEMGKDYALARSALAGTPLHTTKSDSTFENLANRLDALALSIVPEGQQKLNANLDDLANHLTKSALSFRMADDFVRSQPGSDRPITDPEISPPNVGQVYLDDAQRRLYDAQAVIVSIEGSVGDQASEQVKIEPLLPILAALQKDDEGVQANKVVNELVNLQSSTGRLTQGVMSKFSSKDPLADTICERLAGKGRARVSAEAFVAYALRGDQSPKSVIKALENALSKSSHANRKDSAVTQKFLIINNMLQNKLVVGQVQAANQPVLSKDEQQAEAASDIARLITALKTDGDVGTITAELQEKFQAGTLRADAASTALHNAIRQLNQTDDGVSPEQLRNTIGNDFVDVLFKEFPGELGHEKILEDVKKVFEGIGKSLAHMDGDQKAVFTAASKLNQVFDRAQIDPINQKDAHYHPTNYNGVINSLAILGNYMEDQNITHTNAAGIPSQLAHKTEGTQYYSNIVSKGPAAKLISMLLAGADVTNMGLRYRSHDEALAADFKAQIGTVSDVQHKVGMSITGFDVTDGPFIGEALDSKMLANKGVFKSVGEVTLIKEIVSGIQQETPRINSAASKEMLHCCSDRGLPIVLHCDRGELANKNKHTESVTTLIKEWVAEVHGLDRMRKPDPMLPAANVDIDSSKQVPERMAKISWAHAAGVSRFTAEAPDHTENLSKLLSDDSLKGHLYIDLSWDFVAHDITQNTSDLLLRNADDKAILPGMRRIASALDSLIKSYQSFSSVGGQSDKAQDLGDLTLSAVHRRTGSKIAQVHLNQIGQFKTVVAEAIRENPAVGEKLLSLITHHGDKGNNWLNLLNDHSERVMFGTDALAVGTKAHGEAAYAMNTKILYPLYNIFQAVADAVESGAIGQPTADNIEDANQPTPASLRQVVYNVAEGTYAEFFENEGMARRRDAYEDTLTAAGNQFTATMNGDRLAPGGDYLGRAVHEETA